MSKSVIITTVLILLVGSGLAMGQELTVSTKTLDSVTYYTWLTFLTEGPGEWRIVENNPPADPVTRTVAYRVGITTSEIYNKIYLEMITYGDEGCCKKIEEIRKINDRKFAEKFKIGGEFSGFEFIKWLSPTSFEVKMKERNFKFYDIQNSDIKVVEIFEK